MATSCPTCHGLVPPGSEAFPFCSSRCRLVDLGRWLGEEYRIPAVPDEDEDGPGAAPEGKPHPTSPERN